ncbi:MAG TPA: Fic family protein [Puia sp.]|jgi:Fic family protein|nr:Fic family protein [Puia sp.]
MSYQRTQPFNDLPSLPPEGIDLETPTVLKKLAVAARNLGELNGLCETLPDPRLFTNTIVLQESKNSSAIENIVTTQDELYKATLEEVMEQNHAAKEVLGYRDALYIGLERMKARGGLILTNTMVEIVQTIKQNQAGIRTTPGTALKNAINGEVVYTPPTGEEILLEKLAALEHFINDGHLSSVDPLIKLALIHYQFEAIHPFADGNGRTGRIINTLYLVQQDLLTQPVLYLSSYIIQYKTEYYQLLRGITETGNWHDWITYILTAIAETSKVTTIKIRRILALKEELGDAIKGVLGASYNYELLQEMFALPYLKIDTLEKKKIAHRQTASSWLNKLSSAEILRPQKIGRSTYFINHRLMEILAS